MKQPALLKYYPIVRQVQKQGKKIYFLNIGQPDIKTPDVYFKKINSVDTEVLPYVDSEGISELLKSIVDYYKIYNIDFKQEDILVTNGGSEAILFSFMSICDPGDEILTPEPFYSIYKEIAESIDIKLIPITTYAEDGFDLPDIKDIEKLITHKTKAVLITNPSNPTGKVYSKKEVNLLFELVKKHSLYLISDEVYREYVYDGLECLSLASYKDVEEYIVIIESISKRFSACGARIGFIASKNQKLMKQVLKLCQMRISVSYLDQIGAVELFKLDKEYFKESLQEYQKRRDIVFSALEQIEGVVCKKPKGAFYVILKLPVESAEDFILWLLRDYELNNETILLSPASGFYITEGMGIDEVRIAYVLKEEELKKAMNIFKEGLRKYVNIFQKSHVG